MNKQDKLEAFIGCICVFGTLAVAIRKGFKKAKTEREAINKEFEEQMKELDEQSVKRDQELTEFIEEQEKEMIAEDERHTAEMKRLERERKEAEEKHQINMDKLHQYDLRSKERFENAKTKEEKLAALQEDFDDLHAVSNEICESIFGHKLGETKIVFKGKLAEMMEEKKED